MIYATLSYLVAYFVFSFSAKWLSLSHPDSLAVNGLDLLPASMLACFVVWLLGLVAEAAVTATRRAALTRTHRLDVVKTLRQDGVVVTTGPYDHVPLPLLRRVWPLLFQRDVIVAGAASAAILLSSTLAYSRPEVSLLLPLLLMKGGVNLWGPVVSWLRGDGVTTRARIVLGLALAAVVAVLWNKLSLSASFAVGITVAYAAVYVAAYFPKLEVISRYRGDVDFLIAEMTTTLVIALPLAVVTGWTHTLQQSHLASATSPLHLFAALRTLPAAVAASTALTGALLCKPAVWVMALASEGAGLFGGLVFFARVSSTLSVPLNRCTSLLAGFAATLALWTMTRIDAATKLKYSALAYFDWHRISSYMVNVDNLPELVGVAAMMLALWIGLGSRGQGGEAKARRQIVVAGRSGSVLEAASAT